MFVRTPSKVDQRFARCLSLSVSLHVCVCRLILLFHNILNSSLSFLCFSYKSKVELFQGSMDDLDAVRKCLKQHLPDFVLFTAALPRGQPFTALSSAVIPAM